MEGTFIHCAVAVILVFSSVVQLEAITVNPLAPMCPTNKVAPRRKRYDSHAHPRTFGEYYNLLAPNSPSNLQEKPQEDTNDDCGEIEDYDENDIGSAEFYPNRRQYLVTQRPNRRQGYERIIKGNNRPPTHHLLNQHNHLGIKPPTEHANRPTRPPPAGYFGTNSYTPPKPQKPTEFVKPVSETGQDPYNTVFIPSLVGGPVGHIVGHSQNTVVRPPSEPAVPSSNRQPKLYPNRAYVPSNYQQPHSNGNKHHRIRKYNGDTGILGSFVDLFF